MIGIIGATIEEITEINKNIIGLEKVSIYNIDFFKGKFNDKEVVSVRSGIGMVNASIITTLLIEKFNVKKIYFSGVAGSLNKNLKIGDVIIATDLISYLFDATEFGYKKGQIPAMNEYIFKSNLKEVFLKLKDENIFYGRIISGDKFVSEKKEKENIGIEFEALAVDMESSSVAQTCYQLGIDFVIIRSISDSLSDNSTLEYDKFVKMAAENSVKILNKLVGENNDTKEI